MHEIIICIWNIEYVWIYDIMQHKRCHGFMLQKIYELMILYATQKRWLHDITPHNSCNTKRMTSYFVSLMRVLCCTNCITLCWMYWHIVTSSKCQKNIKHCQKKEQTLECCQAVSERSYHRWALLVPKQFSLYARSKCSWKLQEYVMKWDEINNVKVRGILEMHHEADRNWICLFW